MHLCFDPVLREIAAPVDKIDDVLHAILDEMVIMMNDQVGVGLAAPQVGIRGRFLVMKDPETDKLYKMINPRIMSKSEKLCDMEEGCLSVLGGDNLPIFTYVTRPESIAIEWTDENGVARAAEFSGFASRIAQHEIDHLDGILFIDYLSPIKREQVMRKVKKK